MKKKILFLDGVPDKNSVYMNSVDINGAFSIQTNGSCNVYSHLEVDDFNYTHRILDILDGQKLNLNGIDAIFNQISDSDTHKTTLQKVTNIAYKVNDKIKIFNLSENVKKCSRDNVYKNLQDIDKVYVPKTVKINPKKPQDIYNAIKTNKFHLPVIFRVTGEHGGVGTAIINELENDEVFYQFALDGREYYITQYVDYKTNNVYKKYRLAVVDGKVYIRHVLFDKFWMVHVSSREFMEHNIGYKQEELKILNSFDTYLKPHIENQIKQIHSRLGLDYFGIDCYIDDNFDILIFEINANMNILVPNRSVSKDSIWNLKIEEIKNAICTMIKERLK